MTTGLWSEYENPVSTFLTDLTSTFWLTRKPSTITVKLPFLYGTSQLRHVGTSSS